MNKEYHIGDYNLFDQASGTTDTLNTNVETGNSVMENLKALLDNEDIFMGPVHDSCVEGYNTAKNRIAEFKTNINTIKEYLKEAAEKYKLGDESANNNILQFFNNKIETAKANLGITSTTPVVQTGTTVTESAPATTASGTGSSGSSSANQTAIYNYLASQGFNNAAICGILANIEKESGFDPHNLGDDNTSYGICQWHNSRWTDLKNYCSKNGLDSTTVDGQVQFLVWELQNKYPSVYNKIKSVPNTKQGAYDAAYEWTMYYEVPADRKNVAVSRGNLASSQYWSTYGN